MLAIALTTLLLTAGGESGTKVSGFASRGILLPQWELGLRIRIGPFP